MARKNQKDKVYNTLKLWNKPYEHSRDKIYLVRTTEMIGFLIIVATLAGKVKGRSLVF